MSAPTKTAHVDPNAPKPTPWATPCIIHGDKVYLAGIVGRLASGQSGAGTIGEQTKQVLSTAQARLQYVGLDLRDIVSIQIFLTNYERDFDDMNKAYVATMPNDVPFPVRTCVGVASLPKGTEIEMTIIAGKRHGGASL